MTAALLDAPARIHRPARRLAAAAVPALEPWQAPAEAPRRPLLRYLILAAAMAAAPLAMLASAALGSM